MISREFLQTNLKYLNGYLPVYKPPGMSSLRLSEAVKLDIYFVFEQCGLNYGQVHLNHARDLEPFADGLVTFALGYGRYRRKNFALADYSYRAEIEFGVRRQFNSIDGQILAKSTTKDITANRIRDMLPNFVGQIDQQRGNSYERHLSFGEKIRSFEGGSQAANHLPYIDHYNRMILGPQLKGKKPSQKYPYHLPRRTYLVRDIRLDNYQEPYASFTISCRGGFSIRNFASDLAGQLATHASVTKLTRLQEGPIHLDDLRVFQPYELNLEYYLHRLGSLSKLYSDFNDEIGPLWEDIST